MAAAPGFEVLEAVSIRVAPGRILIPDIVIITSPGADLTDVVPVVAAGGGGCCSAGASPVRSRGWE